VRRRAAQDSTAEGRGFSFVDQPDATDQQNKAPVLCFMKLRKIEKKKKKKKKKIFCR